MFGRLPVHRGSPHRRDRAGLHVVSQVWALHANAKDHGPLNGVFVIVQYIDNTTHHNITSSTEHQERIGSDRPDRIEQNNQQEEGIGKNFNI